MEFTADWSEPDVPMKNKTKPTQEVRLGCVKAAVWRNETEAGVRYNVTFSRLYKDGDSWKSTESFGRDDLLQLGKVADQAHSWICAQSLEENNATKAAAPARPGESERLAHQRRSRTPAAIGQSPPR